MDGTVLSTTCTLRDKATGKTYRFERSVDLKPAADYLAAKFHEWHLAQHGEDPTVSGWTDYVKKAYSSVAKVAKSKTVQSIYNQAKPFLKSAIKDIPGGETALEVADKAADVYVQAKKGSKQALAKVKQLKKMAEEGNAKAHYVVKVMQNVGHIINEKLAGNPNPVLPGVSAQLNYQRGGGSLYKTGIVAVSGGEQLVGSFWGSLKKVAEYSPPGLLYKGAKQVAHHPQYAIPGYLAYRGVKAAVSPHHAAPRRPGAVVDHRAHATAASRKQAAADFAPAIGPDNVAAPLAAQMTAPDSAPQYTSELPSDGYADETLYQDAMEGDFSEGQEEAYEDYEAQGGEDPNVSGWVWNRRYRTTPQAIVQSQKSPGLGLAARELYNRGMGRPATDLSQLASAALAEF